MTVQITWWMIGILFFSYFIIPSYVRFLGKSFGKGIVDGVDEINQLCNAKSKGELR